MMWFGWPRVPIYDPTAYATMRWREAGRCRSAGFFEPTPPQHVMEGAIMREFASCNQPTPKRVAPSEHEPACASPAAV
eukprot:7263925-Pyramimonas_sp.AAC.1